MTSSVLVAVNEANRGVRGFCGRTVWALSTSSLLYFLLDLVMTGVSKPISSLVVCSLYGTVTLQEEQTLLFRSEQEEINFQITSIPCGVSRDYRVDVNASLGSQVELQDYLGQQWYQMSFSSTDEGLSLYLRGNMTLHLVQKWKSNFHCGSRVTINVTFPDDDAEFGRSCSNEELEQPFHIDWNEISTNASLFTNINDLMKADQNYSDYSDNFTYIQGTHIFLLPVCAFACLLGICLKFCLCPGKTQMHSSRAMTVIRRLSSQIATGNTSTATGDEYPNRIIDDTCPVYDAFQNEIATASFSEIQDYNVIQEEQGRGVQDSAKDSPQDASDKTLTWTQTFTSRLRKVRSQFSFKSLKEEKEEAETEVKDQKEDQGKD